MLEKCILTILELNWNQPLGHKKTKLNICHHMLVSSTQLQNRSFHVVERTRTSSKCQKTTNARAKRAEILFFIVKYANLRGFCCRRRRGCLSSGGLLSLLSFFFRNSCSSFSFRTKINRNYFLKQVDNGWRILFQTCFSERQWYRIWQLQWRKSWHESNFRRSYSTRLQRKPRKERR